MPDLLFGRVQLLFGTNTSVSAHVKEGKLRVLATTLNERSPLMPDVPSFPETGQAKLPIGPWFALVGLAGLPREIVARMNKEMVDRFLTRMYRGAAADFVRSCQAPVLVMPDDSPSHPYTIAMESVMLAPKSEVSLFPWKDSKDKIPVAVRRKARHRSGGRATYGLEATAGLYHGFGG